VRDLGFVTFRSTPSEKPWETVVEEFKALRAESVRCAGTIATSPWLGLSGFLFTIAAAATVSKEALSTATLKSLDNDHAQWLATSVTLLLLILALQALAITSMFLSEVYKYARISVYIRERIEPILVVAGHPRPLPLLSWENWITDKKAGFLYFGAAGILQLPILLALVMVLTPESILAPLVGTEGASVIAQSVGDGQKRLLWLAIISNAVAVLALALKIKPGLDRRALELRRDTELWLAMLATTTSDRGTTATNLRPE